MKEAIAILTGGGPAPGMNTVVGSVAKTFLAKGYRVIGLHYGYSGLFNPSPRYEDLTFTQADYIFNQGGSYLTMSRFKPTDKDFEENFNLNFFTENNVKLLVTVGGDDTASTANRIAKFLEAKHYPIANIHVPKTIDNDLPLPAGTPTFGYQSAKEGGTVIGRAVYNDARTSANWFVVAAMGRSAGHLAFGMPLPDDRHSGDVQQDGDHRREDRQPGRFVDHQAQDHGYRLRRGHDLGRCVPRPER